MSQPNGELVIQTVAMPKDANANGGVFGGWLFSQMDIGGAILANQHSNSRVTTVAIDKMAFLKPVDIGDLVCCYAKVLETGRASIRIHVEVWVKRKRYSVTERVAEGLFTFVAIGEDGRPRRVDWSLLNKVS